MSQPSFDRDLAVDDSYHAETSSDVDSNHKFEISFTPENNHRRKYSLVASEHHSASETSDRQTACYVHSLLTGQWVAPREALKELHEFTTEQPKGEETLTNVPHTTNQAQDEVAVIDYSNALPEQNFPPVINSRQLTKRQLSDMAWNVRELSKRLASINLKISVKTVFLVTKAHDPSLINLTREVTKWLLSSERDSQYTVYVEDFLKDLSNFNQKGILDEEPSASGRLKYWNAKLAIEKPQLFDFVVTLGGDGTVLYTSALFQGIVPPVLSFSLGSLGFLTKFDFEDYQNILSRAFREGFVVSLRLRFECTVMRSIAMTTQDGIPLERDLVEELVGEKMRDSLTHTPDRVFEILNDVVLDRGPNATMSTMELFGDDSHFTTMQADGLCISTPTGSTAYNLAAGGSLSHPENPVILITAICAHTLSFRPIILPDTMVLRMGIPYDARTSSWASFDGRERLELHPGDYVTVSASRYPFANVVPPGRRSEDWVNSISKTLNWNSRKRQKAFK